MGIIPRVEGLAPVVEEMLLNKALVNYGNFFSVSILYRRDHSMSRKVVHLVGTNKKCACGSLNITAEKEGNIIHYECHTCTHKWRERVASR